MSDFAKIIYEKFFMRDLLGKILPGFIVTITLLLICGIQNFSDLILIKEIRFILWVIIIPWSLLTGLALQILGEFIGLHSSSPRPKRIFFFPPCKAWKKVNEHFNKRLTKLKNASDMEWTKNSREQRERFVYLKEGSGNLALALLFLLIYLLISGKGCIQVLIPLFIISLLFYLSHLLHATRQAEFEIRTMKESDLLKKSNADVMLKRIKSKLLF